MNKKPNPIIMTMVVCDSVLQDVRTNKKSLIGLFNQINVKNLPARVNPFCIFIKLTEGRGEYNCELRCVNANTNDLIAKLNGKLGFKNPNDIIDFNFELDGMLFPVVGEYRFEFLCENELLSACKFQVVQRKK